MTLIQMAALSDRVIAVSTDTRNAFMVGNKILANWNSENNKIVRISSYCIFAAGGRNDIGDYMRKKIIECEADYLEDFYVHFLNIINTMKQSKQFKSLMEDEESAQCFIFGFNRSGKPGAIKYLTGQEVEYVEKYTKYPIFEIIAPSADEANAVMSTFRLQAHNEIEAMNLIINMHSLQSAFFINDSNTVSDEFVYCALEKSEEGVICYESTLTIESENEE